MSSLKDLHRKWSKQKDYESEYDDLAFEFELARAMVQARVSAGLTQAELAGRMSTTQSVISRIESGRTLPSTQTLTRLAEATGTVLKVSFEPSRGNPV